MKAVFLLKPLTILFHFPLLYVSPIRSRKLNVYEALDFVGHATELLERVPKRVAVYDQLDRASTAIPLNIAEGTGKFTPPDRCRYYDTARDQLSSALHVLMHSWLRKS